MSKFPDLISVQVKTAIKYCTSTMKVDYRSNAPGAIRPATPSQTALTVMAEMGRIAAMQGHGDEAIKIIQKVVEDTNPAAPAPAPSSWTPVATLPDSDIIVLIYCTDDNDPVYPGYFDGAHWVHVDGFCADPTHWMPLPMGPTS